MIIDAPQEKHLPALRQLWKEAFGDTDAFLDDFVKTAFHPARCRCITEDEEAVAALYWFDCCQGGRKIAYLYAIATAISHRGKGLCRRLMDDTHDHLKMLGYAGAILAPGSKELFSFYEKLGYKTCSHMEEFSCLAAADSVALRPVDETEFAVLRRQYLPKGSVVQENENLAFVKTMAEFYAGTDFVLTARRETDILIGIELLGNPANAPAIVQSLGCKKGPFRTPGGDIPFSMYRPLDDSVSPPTYFGLAFD